MNHNLISNNNTKDDSFMDVSQQAIIDGENFYFFLLKKDKNKRQYIYTKLIQKLTSTYFKIYFVSKRSKDDYQSNLDIILNNDTYFFTYIQVIANRHEKYHHNKSIDDYFCIYLFDDYSTIISNDNYTDNINEFTTYSNNHDKLIINYYINNEKKSIELNRIEFTILYTKLITSGKLLKFNNI